MFYLHIVVTASDLDVKFQEVKFRCVQNKKKHKEAKIILKAMATFHKLQCLLESFSGHSYSYFTHTYMSLSFFFSTRLEVQKSEK